MRGVVKNGTGRGANTPNFEIAGKTGTSRISFGGKYGYEMDGYRRYQASFAGFFPADNPKYSAIVVLYSGKTKGNFYGATWALPAFREVAEYIYSTSPEWNRVMDGKRESDNGAPEFSIGKADEQRAILAELDIRGKERIMPLLAKGGWIEIEGDSSGISAHRYPVIEDSLANVVNMGLKDAVYILENQGYHVKFSGYGKVVRQNPESGSMVKKGSIIELKLESNETE